MSLTPERAPEPLKRDLRASLADGATFSLNVGLGETYLPAFLLAVGGAQVLAGLVSTVPMLAGAVLQLISPAGVRWVGSLRRWVVACAMVQSVAFAPLIAAAILGRVPVALLFVVAAIYWGAGMATGPAWNTWIGTIIPPDVRAGFFARRSRLCQVALLLGLLAGGLVLQMGEARGVPLAAFTLLFIIAGVSRFASAIFLARHSEPVRLPENYRVMPMAQVFRRGAGPHTRLLAYLLAVAIASNLASPFFTPFMLGPLGLSYVEYVTLIAAAFVAKIVVMPALGKFAQRFGADRLLWIGGIGIIPLAGLWVVSHSFTYLLVLQLVAGCAWGAYELATFLLVFETIRERERTSVLTAFNFANALAVVGGSLAGGALLAMLGAGESAYALVFAVSSVMRGLSLALLARLAPIPVKIVPIAIRALALRPSIGALDRPIVTSLPPEEPPDAAPPMERKGPTRPVGAPVLSGASDR
jgi:MFS family permease